MSFRLGVVISLLFVVQFCAAQSPFSRRISYLEGLPSQTIYDLFVAKNGLIHIGSDKGLLTYNGSRFQWIPSKNALSTSISYIQQDQEGRIWGMNFSNQIFVQQRDSLIPFQPINDYLKLNPGLVKYQLDSEYIWILTTNKLARFSFQDQKIRVIITHDLANTFSDLIFDQTDRVMLVASSDFIFYFVHGKLQKKEVGLASNTALSLMHNTLLAIDKMDHRRRKRESATLTFLHDEKKRYVNHLTAIDSVWWICTNSGIEGIAKTGELIFPTFMAENRVTDIIKDQEGSYWISTLDKGIYYLPNIQLNFFSLAQTSHNRITSNGKGNLFLGMGDGTVFQSNLKGKFEQTFPTSSQVEIEAIRWDKKRNWLLTSKGIYDGKNRKKLNDINLGKSIVEDEFGNFLVCLYNSAVLIHHSFREKPALPKGSKFQLIKYENQDIPVAVFRPVRSRTAVYDRFQKRYVIGYSDGVFETNRMGETREIKVENESLIALSMVQDESGGIWIATLRNGLIFVSQNGDVRKFNQVRIPSNSIFKKLIIANETLYIVSDQGVGLLDLKTKNYTDLSPFLAIKGITILDGMVENNLIYLTNNEGVFYFDPRSMQRFSAPYGVSARILLNQNPTDKTNFSYFENTISFELQGLHYRSQGEFQFQFRLVELDKDWKSMQSVERFVNYLSLPPGTYTFQYRASFYDVFSPIQTIRFTITPPFWKEWWFFLVLTCFVLFLIVLIYRISFQNYKKRQVIKEQLAFSQLKALRAQMNPHFMFNVVNTVQGLIFANKKSEAAAYLGTFSELMRRNLEISEKQFTPISDEIDALKIYLELEKARFDADDFEYELSCDEEVLESEFYIPTLVVQPYVENAIKHGLLHLEGRKTVSIRFFVKPNSRNLCIEIEDNGIGRKASQVINARRKKHTSFATKAIDSRLSLLNQSMKTPIQLKISDKIDPKTQQSTGTLIVLIVPPFTENEHHLNLK